MQIKLDIKEYCHYCSLFVPELDVTSYTYEGKKIFLNDNRFVRCKNRKYCDLIEKYLKRKMEDEKK